MRSRIKWLHWGDQNTRFFHATTVNRRQQNRITMLQLEDKSWCREPQKLQQHVQAYYKNLYTTEGSRYYQPILQQCPSPITDNMNDELVAIPVLEEIHSAVFQLGALKAPGPDGFNGSFYQQSWESIKDDLAQLVQEFFQKGVFDNRLNQTYIVLIPKAKSPENISQFRPISLCNFSYKVISKILANRLKKWLPLIIEPEQGAFVSGRQIQDNIFIVQEVLHHLRTTKNRKKHQAVLKLDMQKAYDRIEWDFVRDVMQQMGFHAKWVSLIMQCISTVTYSVKINGEPTSFFQPSRGLRQGDPLSPYIFILISNVLTWMMKKALADGTLNGIQLTRNCPKLSHLMFADDAIFFLDGNLTECQNLAQILSQYCYAAGQAINLNKSGVSFSANCPEALKHNLATQLRVPILQKTGTYLGIPTDWGRSKKELFAWILARVNAKLAGWKEKLLTKAGKEVLIKSVVQSIPTYAMSIFKLPVSICRAIEQRIASFWWQNGDAKRGMHWKRWEVLKTRKDEGGLGFKDLLTFNRAMLGKQVWRLATSPSDLWSKVMKGIYFPHGDVWTASKGHRPSWGWHSLILGRETIKENTKWSVGDGNSIRIREDRWLSQGIIGGEANQTEPRLVSELINAESREWNQQLIHQLYEERFANEILAVPLSHQPQPDMLIWTGNRTGQYSVKSGYNRAIINTSKTDHNRPSCSYQPPRTLWTQIWSLDVPPKV